MEITVKSNKYNSKGHIIINDMQNPVLTFTYADKEIFLPFKAIINKQTIEWVPCIGSLMIEDYIDQIKIKDELNSLFVGGVEWN